VRARRMIRLKVKEIAESKHITMAKLSRMADLNPGTIRAIYENPNRDVAVTTLEKIARALKVDVSDLYEIIPDE
jgi:DNA-binding Xre family transcriptional regulator